MISNVVSLLIIAYLLVVFPVLLGMSVTSEKKQDVCVVYLYGTLVVITLFHIEAAVLWYLEQPLQLLAYVYGATVLFLSLLAVVQILKKNKRIGLPKDSYIAYGIAALIAIFMVVFRQDTSTDLLLEQALKMGAENRIGNLWVSYYEVLAKLGGVHVTLIGKWMIPLILAFVSFTAFRLLHKQSVWPVLIGWIFVCTDVFPSFLLLWESPWSPNAWGLCCLVPVFVILLWEKSWNAEKSILWIVVLIQLMLYAVCGLHWQVLLYVLLAAAICGIMLCKYKKILAGIGLAGVFVLVFVCDSCIFFNSTFAIPDNRFKMDKQVMEVRAMLEPMETAKMIAPPEVLLQINDGDLKVQSVVSVETLEEGALEQIQEEEMLLDLQNNQYSSEKLIQHARKEQCNIVVAYQEEEALQDALFYKYGFILLGTTKDYRIYQFVSEDLGTYTVTQYPSETGNQAMCYAITDPLGHLILVDGGWPEDANGVMNLIEQNGGKIDVWILTHPHPDHIGAFNEVYAGGEVEIGQIYTIRMDEDRYRQSAQWWDEIEVYERFLQLTQGDEKVAYIQEGDCIDLFGLQMDVYQGFDYEQLQSVGSKDLCNDGGMIFELSGKTESMIFFSDVGACMSERMLTQYGEKLQADYVQMGHHGNGGMNPEVYDVVNPEVAFFDAPESLMTDMTLNAWAKKAHMEAMGSVVYDYSTAPNQVVIQ